MLPSTFDRLTRRAAIASGATLAGIAAVRPLARRAAAQDATPVASPTAGASTLAHPDAEFLFVQVASNATWAPKPDAEGMFTLTLTHQDGQTIYFSDRPERIVGAAPTPNVLDALGFSAAGAAFTPADPPNAAIVAGDEVLVVELTNPNYDAAAGTLAYDASPLAPEEASAGIGHLAIRQDDQSLPPDLGPTALFIDSACSQYTDCWYVGGDGSGCIPIAGTDGFWCIAGAIPGGPIDACWDWGEASCDPCDGSGKQPLRDACNENYSVCDGACDVYVGY